MRLIFCGTPRFAAPTLEKLVQEKFSVELVVTNPDEPSGRAYERKPPPVKETAARNHVLIFQPLKVNHPLTQAFLAKFQPDAIVVVAYGHILAQWMIDLPPLGCINLHASLLPAYRGAAPIPWAIVNGETETGVSTMKIDAGMDTGDVLLSRREPIREDDSARTLSERLSVIGADLMVETLRKLERGQITPQRQDSRLATLAPMLKKEDGRIDWSFTAEQIARRVRGFDPWPGAYTTFRRRTLHIWKAAAGGRAASLAPGTVVVERGEIAIACGQATLLVLNEVQLEGRKRTSGREFLNGARIAPGEKLGA